MHWNIYNRLRVELRDPRVPSWIFLLPDINTPSHLNIAQLNSLTSEQYHVLTHTSKILTKRRIASADGMLPSPCQLRTQMLSASDSVFYDMQLMFKWYFPLSTLPVDPSIILKYTSNFGYCSIDISFSTSGRGQNYILIIGMSPKGSGTVNEK
jgi:hypothetical protein